MGKRISSAVGSAPILPTCSSVSPFYASLSCGFFLSEKAVNISGAMEFVGILGASVSEKFTEFFP